MHTQPEFTTPSPEINTARFAIARLQRHFEDVVDPCGPTDELGCLTFSELTVEDVFPPYPPLPPALGPCDPRADLAAAVAALLAASSAAGDVREILRFAYAVRDLRELESSTHLDSGYCVQHGGRA